MIFKNIFSPVASIIKFTIIFFLHVSVSYSNENIEKIFSNDLGTLSIMYHRFNENKYPSTNIQMNVFKKQMELIKKLGLNFAKPDQFESNFKNIKDEKEILITIDDAFMSFYKEAWPYLKEKRIPFILFVSTRPVGSNGYMNWDQIREIEQEEFAFIGNHSHSHEYLVDVNFEVFKEDIDTSIRIFKKELGYNPIFFSYPFGEYNLEQKRYIKDKFKNAFGQHSGLIDVNKDKFELPRFPINEKYGDIKRFEFLLKLNPLEYKKINLSNKLIQNSNNPPNILIEFFNEQKNIDKINCFSNEDGTWRKTKTKLIKNQLNIIFTEKFLVRRGRVNCSLQDKDIWRWFGLQFVVNKN